ncbi:nuclear transport factor 2 family protein [Rhodanobacter panaciterrae]|nr:nuclear transport factor 2 family protein [Rhodanobacter panaciterrae]
MKSLLQLGAAAIFVFAGINVRAKDAHAPAQREVLGAVDALFDAMAKHDVDASRKLIVPGASFVVLKPDGTVAMEHDSDYLDSLAKHKEAFRERIWSAQVTVQGDIAQVWAPYDFHLDGKLSHCGIDSFSMVRTVEGWRVAGVSYTVQKVGCTPSPLDTRK